MDEIRRGKCPRLAAVLVDLGCDAEKIEAAALEFYRDQRFGDWLVDRGIASRCQVSLALARQAAFRGDYSSANVLINDAVKATHTSTLDAVCAFRAVGVELSAVRG